MKVHKLEEWGFGKAPFKVLGYEYKTYRAHHDAPTQPGGACAICGQGIVNVFTIRSADGNVFTTGPDCVRKADDKYLVDTVKREMNRQRRAKVVARENERIAAAQKELVENATLRAQLAAKPHPRKWRAEKGDTELDWAEWMMRCAGNAGCLQVVRHLKEVQRLAEVA